MNTITDLYSIFLSNPGEPKKSVRQVLDLGGAHVETSIALAGLLLFIIAENNYTDPKEVWEAVANYEDMRKS